MKLEVGMYCRTDEKGIGKTTFGDGGKYDLNVDATFYNCHNIKSSNNIIDLIEEDDIAVVRFTDEFKRRVEEKAFVKLCNGLNIINFETINKERICYFKKDNTFIYINSGGSDRGVVLNDLRIRKLTPKECWRLMGFNDADFDKASQINSNSQLYKQAGNSIVVNVLEAILKSLLEREE